jgi:DNA-binding LacI/PurR family transcriptional regulator
MILPNLINPSHVDLLHAVEEALGDQGYAVLFGNSQNDPVRERRYIAAFQDRRIDGLITAIATDADPAEMRALATEMPVVMVNRIVPGWDGDSVLCDTDTGMALAIDHLASLGHRRIAFLNGDPRIQTARKRRAGFDAAMRKHGLSAVAMSEGVFSVESGRAQVLELVCSGMWVTALCVGNDIMALGVLEGIREAGLRVPEDVSVVGFNDIAYARFTAPSLTTVKVPYQAMGIEAARLILNRLTNRETPPQRIFVQPELVVRRSTTAASERASQADSH